jgi:aspartyl/asparaginyl beta-hydroxylase (cupin superfamily)
MKPDAVLMLHYFHCFYLKRYRRAHPEALVAVVAAVDLLDDFEVARSAAGESGYGYLLGVFGVARRH